eukprot:683317-Pelagomonas_calceolata.AAC.8
MKTCDLRYPGMAYDMLSHGLEHMYVSHCHRYFTVIDISHANAHRPTSIVAETAVLFMCLLHDMRTFGCLVACLVA